MESIDLAAIISVAFFTSLGHCSGMCGGFVVAYTAAKIDKASSKVTQALFHLLYNLGRVSTYALLGAVFGSLGAMISFERESQGIMYILIAVIMILMGISILGFSRFMTRLESIGSLNRLLTPLIQKLIRSQSKQSFFLLGMLNGLLPCGFVYFFAVSAASTASALDGAIVMIVFGLATIPVLFSMGFFAGLLKYVDLRAKMNKIAGLIIIGYGFYLAYKGYLFLFTEAPSCH